MLMELLGQSHYLDDTVGELQKNGSSSVNTFPTLWLS